MTQIHLLSEALFCLTFTLFIAMALSLSSCSPIQIAALLLKWFGELIEAMF